MKNRCPICGMPFDNNDFAPVSFPCVEKEICIICDENISLMFTNFEENPGNNDGYIVPDNSYRLEQVTGRSYQENRLIFYQYVLEKRKSEDKSANSEVIKNLKNEISKITLAISEGKR